MLKKEICLFIVIFSTIHITACLFGSERCIQHTEGAAASFTFPKNPRKEDVDEALKHFNAMKASGASASYLLELNTQITEARRNIEQRMYIADLKRLKEENPSLFQVSTLPPKAWNNGEIKSAQRCLYLMKADKPSEIECLYLQACIEEASLARKERNHEIEQAKIQEQHKIGLIIKEAARKYGPNINKLLNYSTFTLPTMHPNLWTAIDLTRAEIFLIQNKQLTLEQKKVLESIIDSVKKRM